jgi:hypothetical protein
MVDFQKEMEAMQVGSIVNVEKIFLKCKLPADQFLVSS